MRLMKLTWGVEPFFVSPLHVATVQENGHNSVVIVPGAPHPLVPCQGEPSEVAEEWERAYHYPLLDEAADVLRSFLEEHDHVRPGARVTVAEMSQMLRAHHRPIKGVEDLQSLILTWASECRSREQSDDWLRMGQLLEEALDKFAPGTSK